MARNKSGHSVRIEAVLNGLTYAAGLISFLSVVRYVGIFFSLAFVCLFIAALFFDYRRRYTIRRGILNAALLVFIMLNFLRITLDNFATPVVEALLILIAVKFLEEKKTRDYMQIYALSTFLLAGSALLTLDLRFLVNLVVLSFLLPLCIVILTFHTQDSNMRLADTDLWTIVSKALLIPLISIPVTALMFVILPRTGYPLLSFLSRGGASAGFTDNVRLGDISNIQENAAVILRVESEKIEGSMLYWRGIVLDHFDGTAWTSLNRDPKQKGRYSFAGRRLRQTVYLEPYDNKYLFALDKPLSVDYRESAISGDLTVIARTNVERRIKYSAVSVLSDVFFQENIERSRYLQLPGRDFGKVETVVHGLASGKDNEAAATAILHYLRSGQFAYSLKNLPITDMPLEDFLFRYKYGNCEYFASSMAVMLRLAGIPARLVGGYRGGYYNELGGYYLVTQNNAHVWVEAFFDGKGWVRMEPTPGGTGASTGLGRESLLFRARIFFDSLNYYWNAMIIGYDLNRQMSILIRFRNVIQRPLIDLTSVKTYAADASVVLIAFMAAGTLCLVLIKRKAPEKRIIDKFMNIMRKKGYERSRAEGLREFTGKVDDEQLREKASEFVDAFEGLYYRDRRMTGEDLLRLKRLLDDL